MQVFTYKLVNEKRQSMLIMMDALNKNFGGENNSVEKLNKPISSGVGKSNSN